ncbi:MAG: hypothetical protein JNK50_15630 [Bacteroidia bacterium]|nr:hypothetical protein [Bacteroidia bacterium]
MRAKKPHSVNPGNVSGKTLLNGNDSNMTSKLRYKTSWPLFKLNKFILPIVFLIICLRFQADEWTFVAVGIWLLFEIADLGYKEYKLYTDKIVISKKHLLFPINKIEFELPLKRLIDIEFEPGFFDKATFIASTIATLLNFRGRGKADNDHVVNITYYNEFTKETHTETFQFDHRFTELPDIIKKTLPVK